MANIQLKTCRDKLDHYIDHRIREMLPSNATVETPATTTYFLSSLPRLKN